MKRIVVLVGFLIFGLVAALAPPWRETEAQANCFQETGFCITTPQFADYFTMRGGSKTLGFPISRTFTLEGFEVQFFQRVVLQLQGGSVNRLNLLDPTIMPMTRVNQSQFPANDPAIAAQAPSTSSSSYATEVVQFIQKVSPNTFSGQNVKFFDTFNNAVPADAAGGNAGLQTLLNLEIWGLPTSNPAPDPGNGGFIYQRYQRGIMHFDSACDCTQGILVGEYLKAVISGKNLPPDLAADMQSSRYLNQYNPGVVNWVNRPGELPSSNLTGAFEPGTGAAAPGAGQPSTTAPAAATNTPVPGASATPTATPGGTGPTVTIQVDDDVIDSGQSISITVIARSSSPIDWIEWEGIDEDDEDGDNEDVDGDNDDGDNDEANDNDGTSASDSELHRKRFDCDERTDCANVWTVRPTVSGRYVLRARAEGVDGAESEWVETSFRVRNGDGDDDDGDDNDNNDGSATATPTPTSSTVAPSGSPTP